MIISSDIGISMIYDSLKRDMVFCFYLNGFYGHVTVILS